MYERVEDDSKTLPYVLNIGKRWDGDSPATLIIGGKAYTEEEHEAEFQLRVKLLVKEMLEAGTHNEDGWLTVRRQEILGVLDRNGIKLP